jgi:hypothetical protein
MQRSRALRRLCGALLALLSMTGAMQAMPVLAADTEPYSEDAVKAVFLYRFTSFVDWPAEALSPAEFNIAVLDADAVAEGLRHLLPDHPIKDKPAHVRTIQRVRDLGDAQILYVGSGHAEDLAAIVAVTANRPVLVVSDTARGLEHGSTINFILVDRRVRFEVSVSAANRAGLKISSELLSVASRVLADGNSDSDRIHDTRVAEQDGP